MRRLFRLLPVCMLLLAASPAFAQLAAVTGTVTDAGGVGVPNAYLQFDLYGCGGNRPRWTGGVVSSSVQLYGDANGAVTGNVVRNDQITCANTVGNTTYFVQQFINGQPSGPRLQYQINAATFNWNTQVAITQAPVVTPPNGDTVYARLDGGNMPFTGNVGLKGPRPWVDITAFGAIGDGVTDSTTAIQQAINFACSGLTIAPVNATCSSPGDVLVPQGTYKTTACLQTYGFISIIGSGRLTSTIAKSNNANCTAGLIAAPARALNDNYAVDAIMAVVHPTSDYAYHWKIAGVGFRNTGTASTYGLFVPRASQSELENSYISNTGTGFYSNDNWLMTIRHTTVDTGTYGYRWADDGSGNGTGTALTLDNVWAVNMTKSCYIMFGLQYSGWNNTACDHVNVANADNDNLDLANAAYSFSSSTNISLNGAGAEDIHGTVLSSQSSVITVNAMRALATVGYTSAAGAPAYVLCTTNGSMDITASTFDPMTSPGSFFNLLTQLGCMLIVRSTALPTGGNTFNSFSSGSSIINLNAGTITLTNSAGVTTISPISASFGAGATFAGSVIPSVNGGFNSGGPSNAWLNTFQFYHHIIETTAPSSGGGQDICYGDSTAHAIECSYNAGTFFRIPQVIASGTAVMTTAGIATGACGTTVTVAGTGILTTDTIDISHNAAVTIGNGGGLTLNFWPTAGNVNFNYCNSAAGTITPTAMTVNWAVRR